MRIGVVSDTHNNLKNVAKIVELFNEVGVDRVIHTGDITQAKTLDVFAQLHAHSNVAFQIGKIGDLNTHVFAGPRRARSSMSISINLATQRPLAAL